MTHRTIQVVVRMLPQPCERVVTIQVEETDERLKDAAKWPELFVYEAKDAAVELAKKQVLTGWEPSGQIEYEVVSAQVVPAAKNVDVMV
jgi:hypothetical protein